jgi:ABC-type ATPase involved in cell division
MDEPTAHLDDERTKALATELANITSEGRAVLVASHDARIVAHGNVTRVITLRDGAIVPETLDAKNERELKSENEPLVASETP